MPGWCSDAMILASAKKRAENPGSAISAGSRDLTATVRPSRRSVARQTSPIAPLPSRSSSLYLSLSTTPGCSTSVSYPVPQSDEPQRDSQAFRVQLINGQSRRSARGRADPVLGCVDIDPDQVAGGEVAGMAGRIE